jgi:hypothetical protein
VRILEERIAPCSAQRLLERGEDLGRRMAEGPPAERTVSLELTPLEVPSIDIPDVPDVELVATATRSASLTLEKALEVYRLQSMQLHEDPAGRIYIARAGRLLDDCSMLRAASRPIPEAIESRCDGNLWELGWLTLPVGGIAVVPTAADLDDTAVPFIASVAFAVTGPLLALLFDEDELDPAAGEHVLPREEIEQVVADSNAELRRSIGLTEADVAIAGLAL